MTNIYIGITYSLYVNLLSSGTNILDRNETVLCWTLCSHKFETKKNKLTTEFDCCWFICLIKCRISFFYVCITFALWWSDKIKCKTRRMLKITFFFSLLHAILIFKLSMEYSCNCNFLTRTWQKQWNNLNQHKFFS